MAKPNKTQSQGRMRRIFTRLFQIGLFGGIAAVIALIVAVAVTMSSLPGFEAMKSSPNGQMVRVHAADGRSEEHTSELQSLMRISYAVFCLKKKKNIDKEHY